MIMNTQARVHRMPMLHSTAIRNTRPRQWSLPKCDVKGEGITRGNVREYDSPSPSHPPSGGPPACATDTRANGFSRTTKLFRSSKTGS